MNNKFAAYLTELGMTINGNFAYGVVDGFETNVCYAALDNIAPVKFHISCYTTDEQKRNIETAIRNMALKFFRMQFSPYGLSLGFNDITLGRLLKRLPEILKAIYGILVQQGALQREFCPVCGNRLDEYSAQKREIEGFFITLDQDCVNTINAVISEENRDFYNAPNNYLMGFLGACIGGIVGAALAVVLYLVGYISSISAIISILLGTFLYRKFKGKPNKMMIVIVSLTTFAFMIISVLAVYIWAAGSAAIEQGIDMSAFEAFRICMTDSEFARLFYCDLGLVLLFTALGVGFQIFVLAKSIKRRKNI